MVIIDNDTFCIYTRDDYTLSQSQRIDWKKDEKRQYIKYPNLLQGDMKANFLFDPTLTYFINCDYKKECFVVVNTNGNHHKDIPKDQINVVSRTEGKSLAYVKQ